MRILLLPHGRSGSTSLHFALSDVLNLDKIIEPFNKDLWNNYYKDEPTYQGGDIPNNTIIKNLVGQNDGWVKEYVNQFDKIILLVRDNIRDTIISAQNADVYGYINPYTPTEKITPKMMTYISKLYSLLFNFSEVLTSDLVWYEDIFNNYDLSKETIQSLDLNINDEQFDMMWDKYLNPKHRLRK
tara:strand:- start:655 stop:1209 length:555 start_codon:yes stop_codon:yes gene_type:complete